MRKLDFFAGFGSELHILRVRNCQRAFSRVYEGTHSKVRAYAARVFSGAASAIATQAELDDYTQEGYRELWQCLDGWRWVCVCGKRCATLLEFRYHGCGNPKERNQITEYATWLVRRRMLNYRNEYLAAKSRAGIVPTEIGDDTLLAPQADDRHSPETQLRLRQFDALLSDLLSLEADPRIRFALPRLVRGDTLREVCREGSAQGLWPSVAAALDWLQNESGGSAFSSYRGIEWG